MTTQDIQRALTLEFITKRRLNAPVEWADLGGVGDGKALRPPDSLDTDLSQWIDDRALVCRLADGFIELRIQSPDDNWAAHFFKACEFLRIDVRAVYGSRDTARSVLLRISDPNEIDRWANLWPKGFKDKTGHWVETTFVSSSLPTPKSKPIWRNSRPLPGSFVDGELIVWRPRGKPAAETAEQGWEDLEPRPIASTDMASVVRAIAFATLSYWIEVYQDGLEEWDESLTKTIGGWIARIEREGKAINEQGKSLEGVCWSPIASVDDARTLVASFPNNPRLNATFEQGLAKLDNNPQDPAVPGWKAIEIIFGIQAKVGIRRAFRAGIDLDVIERMSEQYVFDSSTHTYIDRDAMLKGLPNEHKHDDLCRQYDNESIFVGGKPKNPFRLYSTSSLRTDVQRREFFPGSEPGSISRYSRLYGKLEGEQRRPDDYSVLNTFAGFAIKPVANPNEHIMSACVSQLDRVLGLLTQDNDAQILYLKKFIAHIAQYPQEKPQVCPIIVGGQGIGKSVLGEAIMWSLFGDMAGSADASSLADNKFLITPFIGKLITFIDEVRLESMSSVNTIKKLVRAELVSGQVKFGHQRDYYIPSRLLIASNSPDIGLSPADAADRAFFFIVSYTAENKKMTEREFQTWAVGLKEFYTKFTSALKNVVFRQHLMRYFMEIEVNRAELENLEHSSRNDESVVRSTMPRAREIARQIVAEAHVLPTQDITAWFSTGHLRQAIVRVDGPRTRIEVGEVLREYERANVVELMSGGMYRFKWAYGRLLQKLSEAHNLEIHAMWPTGPGDFEENGILSAAGSPPWRGGRQFKPRNEPRREYDPDYMENY